MPHLSSSLQPSPRSLVLAGLLGIWGLLWLIAPAHARDLVNIGTIVDGPWERNEEITGLFREEILRVNSGDFDVRFPESAQVSGDHDPASVRAELDRLLADPTLDLIIAAGPLASMDAGRRSRLPKPVIAAFVLESSIQGIPQKADPA